MGEEALDKQSGSIVTSFLTKPIVFVLSTLVFSWVFWAPLVAGIVSIESDVAVYLIVAGGFGPTFGALLGVSLFGGSLRSWLAEILSLPTSAGWVAVVLLIPPSVLVLTAIVHVGIGDVTFGFDHRIGLIGYPISIVSIALLGGGQEEFGWRGYLLPALRTRWGKLPSSILVGIVWAGWHTPLFLVPGTDQSHLPFVSYVLLVLAASVLLTWIFESSGSSLPLAMLFHGGLNAYAYYPAGGLSAVRTPLGYSLIAIIYLGLAILVILGPFRRPTFSETYTQVNV